MKSLFLISVSGLALTAMTLSSKPSLKSAKKILDGFTEYIPSGYVVFDNDTVTVQSFYMSQNEITNLQYSEFLYHLKKEGRMEDYNIAQVDTMKWITYFSWESNTMMEYYHKHPAYHNYPVVNISREGAELYCAWLTEVYDSLSNGELSLKFRIPTRAEYIRAARGSNHSWTYTWGGPFLRNSKGDLLANFVRIGSESIQRDSTGQLVVTPIDFKNDLLSNSYDIIAPTNSYWPNTFGLYNMNGNVAEMVGDEDIAVGGSWHAPGYDIRIESKQEFTESNPMVGFRIVATYLE